MKTKRIDTRSFRQRKRRELRAAIAALKILAKDSEHTPALYEIDNAFAHMENAAWRMAEAAWKVDGR